MSDSPRSAQGSTGHLAPTYSAPRKSSSGSAASVQGSRTPPASARRSSTTNGRTLTEPRSPRGPSAISPQLANGLSATSSVGDDDSPAASFEMESCTFHVRGMPAQHCNEGWLRSVFGAFGEFMQAKTIDPQDNQKAGRTTEDNWGIVTFREKRDVDALFDLTKHEQTKPDGHQHQWIDDWVHENEQKDDGARPWGSARIISFRGAQQESLEERKKIVIQQDETEQDETEQQKHSRRAKEWIKSGPEIISRQEDSPRQEEEVRLCITKIKKQDSYRHPTFARLWDQALADVKESSRDMRLFLAIDEGLLLPIMDRSSSDPYFVVWRSDIPPKGAKHAAQMSSQQASNLLDSAGSKGARCCRSGGRPPQELPDIFTSPTLLGRSRTIFNEHEHPRWMWRMDSSLERTRISAVGKRGWVVIQVFDEDRFTPDDIMGQVGVLRVARTAIYCVPFERVCARFGCADCHRFEPGAEGQDRRRVVCGGPEARGRHDQAQDASHFSSRRTARHHSELAARRF